MGFSAEVYAVGKTRQVCQPNQYRFNNKSDADFFSDTAYRIIPAPEKTFGYEIIVNNKVLIRQLNIPGQSGVRGFAKKSDAEKVARYVMQKLSKGIMPPTVSKVEMNRLKVDH